MTRDTRQDAGPGHHFDGGVDLVREGGGELLVGGGVRVDALAVDEVCEAHPVGVELQDQVVVGVEDRLVVGVLLDLDEARHVVEVLEERDTGHGHVLQDDRLGGRGDDRVLHAELVVGVAVGEVDDHGEGVGLAGLHHSRLERLGHGGGAVDRDEQVGILEVAQVDLEQRSVGRRVDACRDLAVVIDVQREPEGPDDQLLDLLLVVEVHHGVGTVDDDDDGHADAVEAHQLQGILGGLVGLAEIDLGLGEVDGRQLAEAHRGLLLLVEDEARSPGGLLGAVDQARRTHELRASLGDGTGTALAEHRVSLGELRTSSG